MDFDSLRPHLDDAIAARRGIIDPSFASNRTSDVVSRVEAFRLFNGFYEGCPDLILDVYGRTLVAHDYSQDDVGFAGEITGYIQNFLNWLRAILVKKRNAPNQNERRGTFIFGEQVDRKISEFGIWYVVNLTMNRDTGFYLDTRNLRKWIIENVRGKTVLNTFAYTGTLGVAAAAGGASDVIQTDASRKFLDLGKESLTLNNLPFQKKNFIAGDFFSIIARLKGEKRLFDCVILDPPFFSTTPRGKVDLERQSERLINKVRPLINDGGTLVAVNNAVYLSGREYMQTLESLCKDGYLSIRELIPVPEYFIGFKRVGNPISDPAPFNHSTKIAILDVRRRS